jgi:uncharacterized protein
VLASLSFACAQPPEEHAHIEVSATALVSPTRPPPGPAAPAADLDARLLAAAERGDASDVRAALAAGANVNARGAGNRPAVLVATAARKTGAVAALIEAGADVNLRDDNLDSAFLLAGAQGDVEVLRLCAPTANVSILNRFGGTALIPAAERGHIEAVRFLVEQTRVDVNHVNRLGWTALMESIVLSDGGMRHQEVMRLLLRHGADPNIADSHGASPLTHARAHGYIEMARILEAAGAR